jgi:putative tryptophan/tyrosine transport system substrate-binding protein
VTILPMEARTREELDSAFARMIKSGGDSLLLMGDPFTSNQRPRILGLIAKHRLPAISQTQEFVEGGGLMGYGPSYPEMYSRAATFVDKILKGKARRPPR